MNEVNWGAALGDRKAQPYQDGVNVLKRRTQRIADPPVNLDSQQLSLVADRLLSGLEELRQHLHDRLQGDYLCSKITEGKNIYKNTYNVQLLK